MADPAANDIIAQARDAFEEGRDRVQLLVRPLPGWFPVTRLDPPSAEHGTVRAFYGQQMYVIRLSDLVAASYELIDED